MAAAHERVAQVGTAPQGHGVGRRRKAHSRRRGYPGGMAPPVAAPLATVPRLRLMSRISDAELEAKDGKLVTDADYNVLVHGPCRVDKPNGEPLCIYLPGALTYDDDQYAILHSMKGMLTDNRGKASGSERIRFTGDSRTRSKKVASAFIGAMDPVGPKQYCRLTSWTGHHTSEFEALYPLLQSMDAAFAAHLPDRHEAQAKQADATDPYWMIPGTVFTTLTVNNTYPTGVHTDSGDLDAGFSCLGTLRRGDYSGGVLVFPRYRVGVDMRDGDVLLMNAHEHHGNTPLDLRSDDAERISLVAYFRTRMTTCGTHEEELDRARAYVEHASTRPGGTGVVR